MTHFAVMVVGENVEEMLAPFNENLEVAEYEEECWCAGSAQWKAVEQALESEGMLIDTYRDAYALLPPLGRIPWERFIQPVRNRQLELRTTILPKVDPNCESCQGTGKRTSTSNPRAKWDWWQVGGRWGGMLTLKHRGDTVDTALKGEVDFERMERDGRKKAIEVWDYLNTLRSRPRKEQEEALMSRYLFSDPPTSLEEAIERDAYPYVPRAFLHKGTWSERGWMGWFGMSSGDIPLEEWTQRVRGWLRGVSNSERLTIVDCHI